MLNQYIKDKIKQISQVIFFSMAIFNLLTYPVISAELNHDYPRLANYFLKWQVTDEDAVELAKWDVIILGAQTQYFNPEAIEKIRELNPDVKILAYLATESLPARGTEINPKNPLRTLYNKVEREDWWLRDSSGTQINFWPDTKMINIVETDWLDYLTEFAKDKVMSTRLWDGIFYDLAWEYICWLNDGDIDLDYDGRAETSPELNSSWQNAMKDFFKENRKTLGDDTLIILNGSNLYLDNINGRLLEGFPYGYENSWENEMNLYLDAQSIENNFSIITINNGNTENKGDQYDYQRMRYGLASTLMLDGYFSFDHGDEDHAQTWWYDEYDAYLAQPVGEFYSVTDNDTTSRLRSMTDFKNSSMIKGIYRRDFSHGVALLNSTDENTRVRLGGEYEKIAGTQDLNVNNGWRVTSVKLPAEDGLVLLKSVQDIVGDVFINGSYLRVFDELGEKNRSSFFSYVDDFAGAAYVSRVDLDNDGQNELVVSEQNEIQIFDDDYRLIKKFYPYTENYAGKVSFDIGDFDGDGDYEIVSGVASHGGPHVRIFNSFGELLHAGFFAYAKDFRGGVNVSCGDIDGDGRDEIITGANYGGGPHVRIFNGNGELEYPGFFAFDENERNGVNLASGDIDDDGVEEIIAGAGFGNDNRVRIFDVYGKLKREFIGVESTGGRGLQVFSNDLDGDGKDEVLVGVVF